jgi:hypothetical protein
MFFFVFFRTIFQLNVSLQTDRSARPTTNFETLFQLYPLKSSRKVRKQFSRPPTWRCPSSSAADACVLWQSLMCRRTDLTVSDQAAAHLQRSPEAQRNRALPPPSHGMHPNSTSADVLPIKVIDLLCCSESEKEPLISDSLKTAGPSARCHFRSSYSSSLFPFRLRRVPLSSCLLWFI